MISWRRINFRITDALPQESAHKVSVMQMFDDILVISLKQLNQKIHNDQRCFQGHVTSLWWYKHINKHVNIAEQITFAWSFVTINSFPVHELQYVNENNIFIILVTIPKS